MLATYSPHSPVCWQPTALVFLYVGNLQLSWPCILATYTPNVPVCCWQPTAPMFLYAVGNLQPSWPCMSATYSPRGPVCWQPTALMALYVGNPQPSWPCMLATYSTRSPVCWEEEEQRHLLLKATWQVRKKMRDLPIQALRWVRAGPAWRP